jgi:hypothetical protein
MVLYDAKVEDFTPERKEIMGSGKNESANGKWNGFTQKKGAKCSLFH